MCEHECVCACLHACVLPRLTSYAQFISVIHHYRSSQEEVQNIWTRKATFWKHFSKQTLKTTKQLQDGHDTQQYTTSQTQTPRKHEAHHTQYPRRKGSNIWLRKAVVLLVDFFTVTAPASTTTAPMWVKVASVISKSWGFKVIVITIIPSSHFRHLAITSWFNSNVM